MNIPVNPLFSCSLITQFNRLEMRAFILLTVGYLAFCGLFHDSVVMDSIRGKRNADFWLETAFAYMEHGLVAEGLQSLEEGLVENPKDPGLLRGLANVLISLRKEASICYGLDEQQVLDRAFDLYNQAATSDPRNFDLAVEIASSYYLVDPKQPDQPVIAWQRALDLATAEQEREEVRVHLARAQIKAGFYEAASNSLALVRPGYSSAADSLARRLNNFF